MAVVFLLLVVPALVSSSNVSVIESASNGTFYENATTDRHNSSDSHHGIHLANLNLKYIETPFIVTSFLVVLCLVMIIYHHLPQFNRRIPESCLLIILGVLIGIMVRYASERNLGRIAQIKTFSARTFFIFLLPPIMLDSAYSLHDRHFVDNIGTILLFAVVGTLINTFLIGSTLFGFAKIGWMGSLQHGQTVDELTLTQSLLFGCIASAVDPVAVLAIFQEVGVNDVLFFLVFGESLLNDAVTIVLYNTFKSFQEMSHIAIEQYFLAIGAFFTVSLGGLALGTICGFISCLITKYTRHVRVVEPLAVLSMAYFAYLFAELFHWSGILSMVACGMLQWQYIRHNVSKKSYYTIKYFSKTLATACDAIIFLFFGIALLDPENYTNLQTWHAAFVAWSVALCLLYRFIITGGLCLFANRFMRSDPIKKEEIIIMCYSGLRGAVGFSLAVTIGKDFPLRSLFILTIIVVVLFTVFVQGITIKPFVMLLRIETKQEGELSIFQEVNHRVINHLASGIDAMAGLHGKHYVREMLEHFDDVYLKRFLQKEPEMSDEEDIFDSYETIMLHQHFVLIEERRLAHAHHALTDTGRDVPKETDMDSNGNLTASNDMPSKGESAAASATVNAEVFKSVLNPVLNQVKQRRFSTTSTNERRFSNASAIGRRFSMASTTSTIKSAKLETGR